MPVFLAPLIGAAGGVALGYTLDHIFGDSDYTGREMFVDTATGALGGGLVRPLTSVGTRFGKVVRHYGDDAYKVGASGVDDLIVAGYITAPMISRPARMEFIGGAVAGLVYDIAYGKSPDVRSERNASDVTSGGNTPGVYVPKTGHETRNGKILGNGSCKKGFHPRWHTHKNGDFSAICVPNKLRGKKVTFE